MIYKYYRLHVKNEIKLSVFICSFSSSLTSKKVLKYLCLKEGGENKKIKGDIEKILEIREEGKLVDVLFYKSNNDFFTIYKYLNMYLSEKYPKRDLDLSSTDGELYSVCNNTQDFKYLATVSPDRLFNSTQVKQYFLEHETEIKVLLRQKVCKERIDKEFKYFMNARASPLSDLSLCSYATLDLLRQKVCREQVSAAIEGYEFIEFLPDRFFRISKKKGIELANKVKLYFLSDFCTQYPLPILTEYERFCYECYLATSKKVQNSIKIVFLEEREILTVEKMKDSNTYDACFSTFKDLFGDRCYALFAITKKQIKALKNDNEKTAKNHILKAFFNHVFLKEEQKPYFYLVKMNVDIEKLNRLKTYVGIMIATKAGFKAYQHTDELFILNMQNRIY